MTIPRIDLMQAVVDAAREANKWPPAGRRLGKQQFMQMSWMIAQEAVLKALSALDAHPGVTVEEVQDAMWRAAVERNPEACAMLHALGWEAK